ncbi:MAG: phage shock protein PspC [Symbiobacteriaceae bacterium]|jgi:phage shock protein PspC (stress-responsive transcriptional regulator)|nr:phage shock protein PspC [Symbiobacteriaceae bacterium]
MRELRRTRDKKILGVAGGFAEYFDMDKTIWRAIWVFGCIVMPPAILAYFILGMVMPEPQVGHEQAPPAPPLAQAVPPQPQPQPDMWARPEQPGFDQPGPGQPQAEPIYTRNSYKPLTKSRDKWLSGVCAGVAEYFGVDPVLVRAIWLGAVFLAGTGLFLYIVLAILMPEPPRNLPRYQP